MKYYHFPILIEQDQDGYFSSCPGLQGCYAQGGTYEEALANVKDAVRLHVEDRIAEHEEVFAPQSASLSLVEVVV